MYGYTELKTKNGVPARARESGDIIGTGFWNTLTPLIRYHTIDREEAETNMAGRDVLRTIRDALLDLCVSRTGTILSLVAFAPVMTQHNQIDNSRFVQKEPGRFQPMFIHAREGIEGPEWEDQGGDQP